MSKLDVFLMEKADVYYRLTEAFGTAEEHFWRQLGKSLHEMVEDILGEGWSDTFGDNDFGNESLGCVFREEWKLTLDDYEDESETHPAFWFPSADEWNLLWLTGINKDEEVCAGIWAKPISRFLNDLRWPKAEWQKAVNTPLRTSGWLPFGQRITSPTGEWGTSIPIRLSHLDLAKAIESGELRSALGPLEKALVDFRSVASGIEDIIVEARAKKSRPTKRAKR